MSMKTTRLGGLKGASLPQVAKERPIDLMGTGEFQAAVRKADLFRSLDPAAVDRMISSVIQRAVPARGELLRQGDQSAFLYLVVQ